MIAKRFYNTKMAQPDKYSFGHLTCMCAYCGKHMEGVVDDENRIYYNCDCPDALKEHEIETKIFELSKQLPKVKYFVTQEYVLKEIK